MKSLGFVVLLAACSFQSSPTGEAPGDSNGGGGGGGGGGGSNPGSGVPGEAGAVPPDARQCFGTGVVHDLCLDAAPTGAKTLGATNFDTSTDANCTKIVPQTGGPDLCVVAATTITVTGAFVATGNRALVMIAADTLTVQSGGTIDVSSKLAGGARKGAGANSGTCSTLVHGGSDRGGGGGGAGGSFGTAGGKGGVGDTNDSDQPNGTAAGAAVGAAQTPTMLRGGCPGSAGGDGGTDQTKTGGAGGDGGGALYLIAATKIQIDGSLFASGAAGSARPDSQGAEQGGGGGGAGGMIGLDAPTINLTGHIAANGGGGGGGGSINQGGAVAGDGTTTSWNTRAPAGNGDVNPQSGNGGDGAMGTAINMTTNLNGADSGGGGGGGAGGLGVIWTYGTTSGDDRMSPTPTKH